MGKIPDIVSDVTFNDISVVGFCETWLSPTQQSPQIKPHHTVFRCDRNIDNNKGGVMFRTISSSNTLLSIEMVLKC